MFKPRAHCGNISALGYTLFCVEHTIWVSSWLKHTKFSCFVSCTPANRIINLSLSALMGNYITETPAHKILLRLKTFIDLVEKCVITAQQTFYSLIYHL